MVDYRSLTNDSLESFATFARHRNFTHAAAELHIAQPSLHAKINKLSKELGVSLYERSGRELFLTSEGEMLQQFSIDASKRSEDFLQSLRDRPSKVVLFAGRGMLRWVLSENIRDAVRTNVVVDVNEASRSEALVALEDGRADVIGIAGDRPRLDFDAHEVLRCPQVALLPSRHRLSSERSITLADLANEPLVVPSAGRPHRLELDRVFAESGVEPKVMAEVDGWDLMAHMAALGLGVAIVNGVVPIPQRMKAVPVSDLPTVGYWLVWRPTRPGPALLLAESIP